jgi:hypothetical protein
MLTAGARRNELGQLLRSGADWLDITPELYEEAVQKYGEICAWLHNPPSPLARFSPDLYPQGSFRLGTVIRPVLHEDEYDIDLVALLQSERDTVTKRELKALVGDRLKAHDDYRNRLTEGARCWRLDFPKKFHMDILPALPDPDRPGHCILITDRELHRWQPSNPKGFADWFYARMRPILLEEKRAYAMRIQESIDDVPDWRVKTPLQRAVQILKRHRDIYFKDDCENCPASIIVTTLAAQSYNNEPSVGEALPAIIAGMSNHIKIDDEGNYVIENPAHPAENFADRWKGKPARPQRFFEWLRAVAKDLKALEVITGLDDIKRSMEPLLGKRLAEAAVAGYGRDMYKQRQSGQLKVTAGSGILGAAGTSVVLPHTFFGA